MKRFWLLLIVAVLTLSACAEPTFVAQVTEMMEPTETATITATPEPAATATLTLTATVAPTATQEPIILPDWVKESSSELYLCIAPDENGAMHLVIFNPASQEIFVLPIREKDMKGYFWISEPEYGIGWINRRFDEFSILDFSTGTIDNYSISQDSKIFLAT